MKLVYLLFLFGNLFQLTFAQNKDCKEILQISDDTEGFMMALEKSYDEGFISDSKWRELIQKLDEGENH